MEANKKSQEIARELVHVIDEEHRAERSKLDERIKFLEEELEKISVELDATKTKIQGLVAQRDENFELVELMKAKEKKLNKLLVERETIVTNLKMLLQTRDGEISSLEANNNHIIKEKEEMHDHFIKEKEEIPVTQYVLNSMFNECEYFYID